MKFTHTFTILIILFSLCSEMEAQEVCIINTSKRGYIDGEYGIDSLKIIFHYPSLLMSIMNEETGDPTPYIMYEDGMGIAMASEYLIRNDTLYQYYKAVKKLSKPIMYLKGDEILLGSYYNQSNGTKDFVFDNTLVGIIGGNVTSGYELEATAGVSDLTTVAACKQNCPYGLMAAYSYIFVASELMDED